MEGEGREREIRWRRKGGSEGKGNRYFFFVTLSPDSKALQAL